MNERAGGFQEFAAKVEALFTPKAGRRLIRPRSPRTIAGVCQGVADYFGWDVVWVRVISLVALVPTSGLAGVAYVVAWVLIPEGMYSLPGGSNS